MMSSAQTQPKPGFAGYDDELYLFRAAPQSSAQRYAIPSRPALPAGEPDALFSAMLDEASTILYAAWVDMPQTAELPGKQRLSDMLYRLELLKRRVNGTKTGEAS